MSVGAGGRSDTFTCRPAGSRRNRSPRGALLWSARGEVSRQRDRLALGLPLARDSHPPDVAFGIRQDPRGGAIAYSAVGVALPGSSAGGPSPFHKWEVHRAPEAMKETQTMRSNIKI